VRSDGKLLGLTYIREQEILAWHWHTTGERADGSHDAVRRVCVVPESDEDVLYVLVARTVEGDTRHYIERLERRFIDEDDFNASAFFVDSGLSYAGAPANNFTGLDHLEGEVVAVLADGAVIYDGDPTGRDAELYRVTNGQIDLAADASDVHIGLPIRYAEIETLDPDVDGSAIRDRRKAVQAVTLWFEKSARTFRAGPAWDRLTPYKIPPDESPSAAMYTGSADLPIRSAYTKTGRVMIRHSDPLPLTILGLGLQIEVGG
jgi:hypothetical protein